MAHERVVVSVVSGSDPGLIRGFLRSLYRSVPEDVEFVVAVTLNLPDAATRDQIAAETEEAGSGVRVEVRTNDEPLGFAANHNRAIRDHPADYYLISNDDVVVLPDAIGALLAFMRDPVNARVGVASPNLLNADRTIQGSTYSFPSPLRVLAAAADLRANPVFRRAAESAAKAAGPGRSRFWAHDRTMTVDSVRGAFMLVRQRAIAEVGLMDEIALVGGEEIEWHRRMADRDWKVAFVSEAAVIHLGAQTVGGNPGLRVEYAKGWLNYFQKHGRRIDVGLIRLGLLGIYAVRYLVSVVSSDEGSRAANRAGLRVAVTWPDVWKTAASEGRINDVTT